MVLTMKILLGITDLDVLSLENRSGRYCDGFFSVVRFNEICDIHITFYS